MEKPTICIGENKAADQPCSNCTADQRLCFRSIDSTIPLLLKSEISRFWPAPETVQAGLCRTWSETQIVGFLMHRLNYVLCMLQLSLGSHWHIKQHNPYGITVITYYLFIAKF